MPPVNVVNAEGLRLAWGTRVLLDDVSLGVQAGQRIGVVGRNGDGKSTLLRVLAGLQQPDAGRISWMGEVRVGVLAQADELDPNWSVHHALVGERAEHEWASSPRIRQVLAGLAGDLDRQALVGSCSGGERRRISLARLLIDNPEVLFLDEPTNHLDIDGIQWLANFLVEHRAGENQALVTVTHDRWFLDAVTEFTWEVVDGRVEAYEGGYAAYVLAKNERARIAAATEARRNNLLRKELAWLRRGAPARTSKPKFRIEAANDLIRGEPEPRDEVELVRFATSRLGKDVVDLLDATVVLGHEDQVDSEDRESAANIAGAAMRRSGAEVGADQSPEVGADSSVALSAGSLAGSEGERLLLNKQTWRLAPGERTGILGANGAGKSTLLRTIAGLVPLQAGKRKQGSTVNLAYLSQEVTELHEVDGRTVIDAITLVRGSVLLAGKEVSASSLAKRLGFSGARQQDRVGDLSGGERRRLQFLRLLMTEPNVLLLDEPTNDLDIETLASMEDVLDGWAGTLVVVSHDRYLLERMCSRQVGLFGDGIIRDLPGGVAEYIALRAAGHGGRRAKEKGKVLGQEGPLTVSGADDKTGARSAAAIRLARKAVQRLERQLEKNALAQKQVQEQMEIAAQDALVDHKTLADQGKRLKILQQEQEDLEMQWLAAAEAAE